MSENQNNQNKCKLYLISPPNFEIDSFPSLLSEVLSFCHVPVFQLRMKSLAADGSYTAPPNRDRLLKVAKDVKPICMENGTALIINDDVEIAKEVEASGVHLGVDDKSVKEARGYLGDDYIIGASCYASKDRAFTAGEQGANYVAFGAFYETQTKKPKGRPELDLLEFWRDYANIPAVAIGGIKVDNAKPIIEAGADFIAVVTGVWDYKKGPHQAVKDFTDLINSCD
jgi:thiamine-phosphate pyrophosphorylase